MNITMPGSATITVAPAVYLAWPVAGHMFCRNLQKDSVLVSKLNQRGGGTQV